MRRSTRTPLAYLLPYLVPALLCIAAPVRAESMASSASSATSASVGSLSASVDGSSDSSRGKQQAAAGEYRVATVHTAGDRHRVRLERLAGDGGFVLLLPAAVPAPPVGATLSVQQRPYGLAFALAGDAPFYLALNDAWRDELALRQVGR